MGIGEALAPQAKVAFVPHRLEALFSLALWNVVKFRRSFHAVDESASRSLHFLAKIIEGASHMFQIILRHPGVADCYRITGVR